MASSKVNLAAVIEAKGARFKLIDRPVPTPGQGEILVRNHAVAANPVDWKIQDYGFMVETYPNVLGSDVAGVVEAVGAGVSRFKVGDRVAGFSGVLYNQNIDHGAWQTYTILPELASYKIPANMRFEAASVFPMAMATGAMAMFNIFQLPRDGTAVPHDEALLVWGAASSVGASTIQIARNLGWEGRIFATASPRNHGWLRDLGATEVFDYRDAEVTHKVAAAASAKGFAIRRALDAVSEGDTFDLVSETMRLAGGASGTLAVVLPWPEDKHKPEGLNIGFTEAWRHASDQKDTGRWIFNEWLESSLASGKVVSAPEVQVVDGGIGAAQEVMDQLKSGVSGKKLVVQVK